MICSAVAFHTNGFGSVFQCSAHSVIAAVRSATLVNTPRRSRLSFSSLNQRSIRLSHELEVGLKCKCQRRRVLVRQPLLHLGRGVGIRGRRWCPSPDLRCPFEHDCDSTGERERRSYRVWPRKCLLQPGPAEPMTSAARLTDDPTCRGPVTRGGPQWPSVRLGLPGVSQKNANPRLPGHHCCH